MRNRTWLAALALTGCALMTAGCKAGDTASPAASSSGGAMTAAKSTSAADEVIAAADKLRTTRYKFSTDGGGFAVQGAADPANKVVTMDAAMGMTVLMVDGQIYLKLPANLPGAGALGGDGKWLHVDAAKFAAGKLGIQDPGDPGGAYNNLKGATSVQKVSDKHYKGTLDLTKTPAFAGNSKLGSTLGDSAKAVPFEATVDDNGYLSSMDTTMTVNGTPIKQHTTFSDFGTKVTVAKPAPSEVTEAPESIYGAVGA
ncbi:hypothetical protein HC031_00950 [Planosporangium thailandense]|uniref:Lipoprotein n=1 Tax=Planosporangium thailandense TaxID=765197 RepID=A0ABX0XQT0_9ACTN|nr:hypothetical protein [Planosporangium thailandense]NJC68293.1 hypothetical protein [Planosporangium thailandense]